MNVIRKIINKFYNMRSDRDNDKEQHSSERPIEQTFQENKDKINTEADIKIKKFIEIRESAFADYIVKNNIKKLQIAAGPNYLPGWFNTDLNTSDNIYYLNLKERFPFPENTFNYIYSEHGIEHFSLDEGVFILRECFKTLISGGKIRIATPDLKNIIEYYNSDASIYDQYTEWEFNTFIKKNMSTNICTKSLIINNFYRCWGHKLIFDFELL